MKISSDFPIIDDWEKLGHFLGDRLRLISRQLNGVSEGLIAANHGAMPAPPTNGAHAVGDFVRNSVTTELGAVSAKYVITGWYCVGAGTPGTWVAARCLTGN